MADSRDFLGKGLAFPPAVDSATGRFRMVSAEEDIRQSIYLIVMTRKNERAMLPEFGCNIHDFVFELPDASASELIRTEIIDALIRWEPRVIDTDVDIDTSEISSGKIILTISYTVRSTNNPNNLVFPFYLYEGVGEC